MTPKRGSVWRLDNTLGRKVLWVVNEVSEDHQFVHMHYLKRGQAPADVLTPPGKSTGYGVWLSEWEAFMRPHEQSGELLLLAVAALAARRRR